MPRSLKVVQQVRFHGLKLVSLCFSFYYSKHQRNPRPPYPLLPECAVGHFQSISYHLELIVLFLYLYKKQFHLFCGELQVLREASCLPPTQCPSQTGQCTAWRWPGYSGSRWSTASRCEDQRALGRWGRGPWRILRQTSAHHSSRSSVCSRWKHECWEK